MLKWLIAAILALLLISGSTLGGEVLGPRTSLAVEATAGRLPSHRVAEEAAAGRSISID